MEVLQEEEASDYGLFIELGKAAISIFGIPKRIFKCIMVLGFINVLGYMVYLNYPNVVPMAVVYLQEYEEWVTVNSTNGTQVKVKRTHLVQRTAGDNKPSEPALSKTIVNPHVYKYVINQEDVCSNGTVDLMIVVTTAVSSFPNRKAIRDTWGSAQNDPKMAVRMVFLVGSANNSAEQYKLQEESDIYQDIIQKDFKDTYRNLTIKTISLVKWVSDHCSKARYVLKVDDDMYINVPLLITKLKKVRQTRFFLCAAQRNSPAIRNPKDKWFVTKREYAAKSYPTYCSGSSYAISGSIVSDLFEHSQYIPFFWLEDVFLTGFLGKRLKVHHEHNRLFQFWRTRPEACLYKRIISSHHVTPRELYRIWEDLHDDEIRCEYDKVLDVVRQRALDVQDLLKDLGLG